MSAVDFSRRSLIAPKSSILPRPSGSCSRRNEHKIVINVGGIRYETYRSTLKNIPDTRLAWLTNYKGGHNPDFDSESGEYFFDRHPGVFNMILNYYRTGKLHAPTDVCGPLFEEELAFWGLDEKQIEPCCWSNYRAHRDAQETLAEMDGGDVMSNESDTESCHLEDIREKFGIIEEHSLESKSFWARFKPKIWKILDEPTSSTSAKIFAFVSFTFLIISIMSFCLESHIMFRESVMPDINITKLTVREKEVLTKPMLFLDIIEYICVFFFTVENILRLVFCPDRKHYLKQVFSWIDISVVIPCFFCYIMLLVESDVRSSVAFRFMNALRLIRIFRIFKLTVHVSGLKILGHTIKASAKELLLLFLVLIIGVLIFACLIYYAEQVHEAEVNSFSNIPRGFWWAVVTMTTLGYGDLYPRTALGYIIGTVCAVSGLLMLSLPVPVIVSNFTLYYTHAQARLKLPKKAKKQALLSAANALVDPDVADTTSEESTATKNNSLPRTSSEDSAFGSYPDKFKEINETYYNGKNGKVGISVIFTEESPNASEDPTLSIESIDKIKDETVDDKVSDEEISLQSRDSLTPHRHSFDQNFPRRQRRVSLVPPGITASRRSSIRSAKSNNR
ncbi:potassium voltage-gated channel protein Shaw-like isoform X3 [Ruditapes philippinarum]|uniref:potassium voltage-gated channel protein Shaw-like isoform X3 n=1 Tax=Ruditapes philippinarum TaxID=129788 RepID=UPI00295B1C60|nr:potassium voltage-gated channel protein Shaw-like isoform X3 [Ruditapes philippinarum]